MNETVSVVIPAFNEAKRIERTVKAIHAYLSTHHRLQRIIVADDGSTDGTAEVLDQMKAQYGLPLTVIRNQRNHGKGNAVRQGVVASTGELVLVTDADLATPIEEVEALLDRIRSGADIAIGSRGLAESQITLHQPLLREFMGKAFNLLTQLLILPGIWDTQCGFKLFRGQVARRIFPQAGIDGFAFDVEVLGLAVRRGFKVAEVPVRWHHVDHSKVRLGPDGVRMLRDIVGIAVRLRLDHAPLPEQPSVHETPGTLAD